MVRIGLNNNYYNNYMVNMLFIKFIKLVIRPTKCYPLGGGVPVSLEVSLQGCHELVLELTGDSGPGQRVVLLTLHHTLMELRRQLRSQRAPKSAT